MSDFKVKVHQIQFRLGLRPRPCLGSLQRSPYPLAGFKWPTFDGRGGERWKWRERRAYPILFSADLHPCLWLTLYGNPEI